MPQITKRDFRIIVVVSLVMLAVGILAASKFMKSIYQNRLSELEENFNETLRYKDGEREAELASVIDDHQQMQLTLTAAYDNIDARDLEIQRLSNLLAEKEMELDAIKAERNEQYRAEFTTLAKYWYVFKNALPRSTVTPEMIIYLDTKCQERNVNPHMMWIIYYLESKWDETAVNSKSNATGLGQIIPSTGKAYWLNILKHDSFSTSMLLDPYVNIDITVEHIARDLQAGKGLSGAINHYSGGASGYLKVMQDTASRFGISSDFGDGTYK